MQVGSLMVMFCKEYHVQPAKVIEIILTMNGTMEHRSLNEVNKSYMYICSCWVKLASGVCYCC